MSLLFNQADGFINDMTPNDISKQNALYNYDFAKKGVHGFLGRKRLHFNKIIRLLDLHPGERILEIGCNRGELVKTLREVCPEAHVEGCDINKDAIGRSEVTGLSVMMADSLQFDDNTFDKIVSSHTLEHVHEIEKALSEIKRVLKPNGVAVLIYPFELFRGSNNIFSTWHSHGNPMLARKLHVHKLSPKRIEKLAPLQIIHHGFFFGPFPTYFSVLKK